MFIKLLFIKRVQNQSW